MPKKQLRFQPGMKVECLVEDGWLNGTITKLDAFANGRIVPYQIRIDSGDMRGDRVYAPVDNDRCVHLPARFKKGDAVEVAREGWRDHWLLGRVVATWVEDDGRDGPDRRGTTVPYKVEIDPSECPYLETGDELVRYVAEDDDRHVHRPARFDEGDRVECWVEGEWRAGPSQVRGGGQEGKGGSRGQEEGERRQATRRDIGPAGDADAVGVQSPPVPPPRGGRPGLRQGGHARRTYCVHVTATPLGFYVSRSTGERYDPRPVIGEGATALRIPTT